MKVLFLINNQCLGVGGHFYSLKSTVESLQIDKSVINLGKPSKIVDSIDTTIYNTYNKINIFSTIFKVISIANKEKPTIIHAFDGRSIFYALLLSKLLRIPYVLTLCGGPCPKVYSFPNRKGLPHVDNLILFTEEHVRYFDSIKNIYRTNIYYYPNRINITHIDNAVGRIIRNESDTELLFLRIARISKFHHNSIMQSVNLVKKIRMCGIDATLVIIGILEDLAVFNDINESYDFVKILTDEFYTYQSSRFIAGADCVIGSGRSFMEGAQQGKIMFCPTNGDLPVLVTDRNIDALFSVNFSSRGELQEQSDMDTIVKVVSSDEERIRYKKFIKEYSKENFETDTSVDKLLHIYESLGMVRGYRLHLFIWMFIRQFFDPLYSIINR